MSRCNFCIKSILFAQNIFSALYILALRILQIACMHYFLFSEMTHYIRYEEQTALCRHIQNVGPFSDKSAYPVFAPAAYLQTLSVVDTISWKDTFMYYYVFIKPLTP